MFNKCEMPVRCLNDKSTVTRLATGMKKSLDMSTSLDLEMLCSVMFSTLQILDNFKLEKSTLQSDEDPSFI